MSGGGNRVQIPNSMRKTIQNIKEITGNHSEDEIYAMLKECSMDPNETAQKLLFLDPFHEVKRKRDKRKENLNNRESAESRWRATTQGRGSRGGRANFSPRHTSNDAGGGRNSGAEKSVGPSLPVSPEKESKEVTLSASSAAIVANGPTVVASGSTGVGHSTNFGAGSSINQPENVLSTTGINESGSALPPVNADKSPSIALGAGDMGGEPMANSSNSLLSMTSSSSSAVCFSSSDPVLVPTSDSWFPSAVGAIKWEVGSSRTSSEQNSIVPAETKLASASEIGGSFIQGKLPSGISQGVGKTLMLESSQPSSSLIHGGSSGSRPSSNYSNRSQAVFGPQKVGSNKEWKPKPTASGVAQGSGTGLSSDIAGISIEASAQSLSVNVLDSEEATSELHKKLEDLHLPQRQHVIIPNHIHVPESERTKLSFGSFDASFGVTSSFVSAHQSEKSSTPLSETSHGLEETSEELAASSPNALATAEEEEEGESPSNTHKNFSDEGDVSSGAVQEFDESKQETALSEGHQYSVVHTSPNYNYGFMPPIIGSQASTFENSESQARDVSRFPSFMVQQPFDPTSYSAQFYRSGADSDGRVSPFPIPGVATKYNGNVAVLPPQNSQSHQEGGNLVLSAAGPTPLVTQAAGLMQSLAVTQQPVPVFRPPAGLHISPYPTNYIPYGHYFSPFYVPSPAIHQFMGNGAFPQQPQAGGVYPAPPAAASGVKYPLPQYKSAANSGNSTQIGVPSGYGPYSSSPAGYNPSAAVTAGNSASNEDLTVSQFKENNAYITGQQNEGSAVWIAGPGRDISSLPTTSFYNLPPQGQHMTFAPSQAGHGTFAGIYHPAQAVTAAGVHPLLQQSQTMAGAVDMAGPAASVYQQPQHAQINWASNY